MDQDQNHPLYLTDRSNLDRLLAINSPKDSDLVELARLFMRYEEFPGARDIQADISKILKFWGISKENLQEKTRNIWANGYRPGGPSDDSIGSGFDTSEPSTL